MNIKHIIDSELKDLSLDLIIESLDEIINSNNSNNNNNTNGNISNGNFTTSLSEDDSAQGLNEDLNKISLQNATDRKMFGPVYHGTTQENQQNIEQQGFKIFVGADKGENIRHGYPGERDYAHGIPPPIHHLGYGIYFTTVKTIGKQFNMNSVKGLKAYYLDVPRLQTINFASSKRMMDWWLANGYDGELAKSGQEGRVEATKKLTETLKNNYDAVWFKGKSMYKLLDGDQIVVFDTNNIYQIDSSLAGELEIGSKVRRTEDKFDYQYKYSTDGSEPERTLKTIPTVPKGTIGIITGKKPVEPMLHQWHDVIGRTDPHWAEGSDYIYVVKWNKGGTESNMLDKYITPYNVTNKKVAEIVKEELESLKEDGDVVVDIVNDELNKNNCTLEEDNNAINDNNENNKIISLSENVYKVYHGTNQKFSKFNFKNATQGIVWFTDSIDSIKQGEHGGAGNKIIMTRYITINKPAGWAEYEKYGLGQLQGMGYDGVILPQGNKTDYIVFSPKNINAKDSSENNINESEILSEGLSNILYHFTYISHLINILKYNKFATSSNLGSNADSWKDKGRFYFFSTQRTKGMSGYGRHHGNVAIVLDGRKLNQTFKGSPTDYWNYSTKRSDYKSIGDYTQALQSGENEDRIVTNKPYIDNANNYIIEIHIFIIPEHNNKETINQIVTLCKGYNLPVYFYLDENNFKLQNKTKAVDPNSLDLIDKKEKSEYDVSDEERDVYNAKWFFKKIAPVIIAGNNMNDNYNDEKDAIEKLLKQLLDKNNQSDQFDNVMQEINEKANKMNISWGHFYADDEYRSMQAEIHNNRGNPNPYLRELLKMLVSDMKKWRVNNLKEYFNKKFQAGIKEDMENNSNSPVLNEVKGEFHNVFHGTSTHDAENIIKRGVKIEKSTGGYFGWGFYTAIDYNLAKTNYAEFADDNALDEKGVILEFSISPDANILDLRKDEDFKIWQPYSNFIFQPDLYKVLVKNGIDGVYDNSFEGVVIYNPKILTLFKEHYL